MVKDKWSRIVTGNPMEYSSLEQIEKENMILMKKKRKGRSKQNFAQSVYKGKLVTTPDSSIRSKFKMAFNFAIRPEGMLGKREFTSPTGRSSEVDKYLNKLRKEKKRV